MTNQEHSQHLLSAEQARQGLANDLRKMNNAGEDMIRHGKYQLKRVAITHGVAALSGLVVGAALGRVATSRRGNPVIGELFGRAITAFATMLTTQLVAALLTKRS